MSTSCVLDGANYIFACEAMQLHCIFLVCVGIFHNWMCNKTCKDKKWVILYFIQISLNSASPPPIVPSFSQFKIVASSPRSSFAVCALLFLILSLSASIFFWDPSHWWHAGRCVRFWTSEQRGGSLFVRDRITSLLQCWAIFYMQWSMAGNCISQKISNFGEVLLNVAPKYIFGSKLDYNELHLGISDIMYRVFESMKGEVVGFLGSNSAKKHAT